jgi:hypothetical protein
MTLPPCSALLAESAAAEPITFTKKKRALRRAVVAH